MSRLFDIIQSIQINDQDTITTLLEQLQQEIEQDQSIYNSDNTMDLDYLYKM